MNPSRPNAPVIHTPVSTLQSTLVHPSELKGNQGTGEVKRHLYSAVASAVYFNYSSLLTRIVFKISLHSFPL